jgi:hypothetical protein
MKNMLLFVVSKTADCENETHLSRHTLLSSVTHIVIDIIALPQDDMG